VSTIDIVDTAESASAFDQSVSQFVDMCSVGDTSDAHIDETCATQTKLAAWQSENYGGPQSDERMALGIVEEMTEAWMSAGDDELPEPLADALDGLGDVCVYAAQLATSNRLAIGPILDLARVYTSPGMVPGKASPTIGPGMLAQAVLKHAQKIRGVDRDVYQRRLVRSIAMCVARVVDDIEMTHAKRIKIRDIFHVVAGEVMERKQGHPSIPKVGAFDPVTMETDMQRMTIGVDPASPEKRTLVASVLGVVSFHDGKIIHLDIDTKEQPK
jgi:hypothetical protein